MKNTNDSNEDLQQLIFKAIYQATECEDRWKGYL